MQTPIGYNYQKTNDGIVNYIADFNNNHIILFDADWNYLKHIYHWAPSYIETTNDAFYVSSQDLVCKYNIDLVQQQCISVGNVDDMFYDAENDLIIMTRWNSIRAIRPDMTTAYDIPISDFPWGLEKRGNKLYISTNTNKIMVIDLDNNNAVTTYNNICPGQSTVTSILFDNHGYVAVACLEERKLYLYNDQIVYQNKSIETSAEPFTFKFDTKGRFIVTSRASQGSSGVDIFYK